MKLTALVCSNCSAPIEVPAGTEYLVCNHCGASLRVESSSSATYTVVLEAISERTEQMAKDLAHLKKSDRLRRLDDWWEKKKKRYMLRDKHGREYRPGKVYTVFAVLGTVALTTGLFFTGSSEGFLIGIAVAIVGTLTAIYMQTLATNYRAARAAYERKRKEILDD